MNEPFIFLISMSLFVLSVVHSVLKFITPSAKCCMAVSALGSCIPSVKRSRWKFSPFLFCRLISVRRLIASWVLRVNRTSEIESIIIVLFCFISSVMVCARSLAFDRVLNFQFPLVSRGVMSQL